MKRIWILVSVSPAPNLHDPGLAAEHVATAYPLRIRVRRPERMGAALDLIVSGGSIVSPGRVRARRSGYDVRAVSYCEVEDSIRFNHVSIGRHSPIRRVIIDWYVASSRRHRDRASHLEADRARLSSVSESLRLFAPNP